MSEEKGKKTAETRGKNPTKKQKDSVTERKEVAAGLQETAEQMDGAETQEQLQEENRSLQEELLRQAADFDNFRKRMLRDKEDGIMYANGALLTDLIAVIDDFERAIQSAIESKDFDSFHTGVAMIEKQMVSMLERNWGLKRFDSVEEEFDPEKHQAIAMEESNKYESSIVLEDYQKGYTLHDRVLRPSKVKVSKPIRSESAGDEINEEDKE